MNADLKKKKWDAISLLSEIVTAGDPGLRFNYGPKSPKVSSAVHFLEALGMIEKNKRTYGLYYQITPLGKRILKEHITKALIGEQVQ